MNAGRKNTYVAFSLSAIFLMLIACTDQPEDPALLEPKFEKAQKFNTGNESLKNPLSNPASPQQKLIEFVGQLFSELISHSKQLQQQVVLFAKSPSDKGLQEAISTLKITHSSYTSIDILRTCCLSNFYEEPFEDKQILLHARLDQHPLLPGYLDTVVGYPYSGIVHADIPITKETMLKEFQLGDPHYVTLGFHALEVLLKGGGINRTAKDFSALSSTDDISTAKPELRRTLYAILLASEINKDLSELQQTVITSLKIKLAKQTTKQSKVFVSELQVKLNSALEETKTILKEGDISVDHHLNSNILNKRIALIESLLAISFND